MYVPLYFLRDKNQQDWASAYTLWVHESPEMLSKHRVQKMPQILPFE